MQASANDMIFGGIIAGGVLIALVAIVGGLLHSRRDRMLSHAERMKALEMGRELPDDPATARLKAAMGESDSPGEPPPAPKSLAVRCYSTTGYVCGTGFVFAWLSSEQAGVAIACASAAGMIGVTGMICGTILASKEPSANQSPSLVHSKPLYDPEAV